MTASGFRKIALSMPEAVEDAHMGHPDFRVGGRIFATLAYPDAAWAMVKLTREQQDAFTRTHPKIFHFVKGGWGARGATNVRLAAATTAIVRVALHEAWRNVAPKRLLCEDDDEA